MTYKFLTSSDFTEYYDKLLTFCLNNASAEDINKQYSLKNYDADNWISKPYTLLYLLFKEKRFDELGYCVDINDAGNIIAGSGLYRFEHDRNLVISARMLKDKNYRGHNKIISGILREQIKLLHYKGAKGIIFTHDINDPNKKRSIIERGQKLWWLNNDSVPELKDAKVLEFNVLIKNTPQFILYKMFDDYEFDWESIRV